MNAPVVSRLAHRGSMLLAVAILAMTGLAGVPAADNPAFPAVIQMFGDTPSGVAVDKPGNVYVSVREPVSVGCPTTGRNVIYKYTRDGTPSFFANMGCQAVVYGLAATPNGDVYAAMAAPGTERGIYKLDRKGNAERLPGTEGMSLPNGLAFDDRGNLFVTESFSGAPPKFAGQGGIWRITPKGEAEVWVQDDLLTGIGLFGNPPMGANGIAYYHGDLYVTNTDQGLVLRIPVQKDGSAGEVEEWKKLLDVPESPLKGTLPILPDGLALDVHGNLYTTILTRNAVVRLMADTREQQTVAVLGSSGPAPSAQFDFPASLAFGTGAGEQQNLFVTNLGWMSKFPIPPPPLGWPGAALVKVHAGAPGRPLH